MGRSRKKGKITINPAAAPTAAAAGDPDADPEPAALTQGPRWYPGRPAAFQGNPEPRRRSGPRSDPRSGPRAAAAAGDLPG